MADLSSQPYDQLLKTLKVVCRERAREVGTLVIKAPPGICFNECTNSFEPALQLRQVGGPTIRSATVCPDIVVNHGVVRVDLISNDCRDPMRVLRDLEIPFSHVLACPGAMPGDVLQKHDIQVTCLSLGAFYAPATCGDPPVLKLELLAVVDACVIVARETLLKVSAIEVFCS